MVAALCAAGDGWGARFVASMPHRAGVLDAVAVDRLLVRTHTELQRLNEELRIAEQLAELVGPLLAAVADAGRRPRIVDVGCGIGYAVRWLASSRVLGDVELCGVDVNGALVAEAARLAAEEGLSCRFVHADASTLPPASVYISLGLLHHLRDDSLGARVRRCCGSSAHSPWRRSPQRIRDGE